MTSDVATDQTTGTTPETPAQKAAVNALAVVGFVVLLIIGITLAIYSARYVPLAVSKLGTLSNNSNNSGSLSVITASSSIPFGDQGSDVLTATTSTTALTPPIIAAVSSAPATQPAAEPAPAPYQQQPVVSRAPALYGLPDLSVTIIATGYLAGPSTASFVPASVIPPGARPAIEFSIANDGTNVTGPWNFLAQIPSINDEIFNSPIEPSLNPGDHTVFTLGFNEAIPGPSQPITIVADPNNTIPESSKTNNTATAAVTITQTGN